MHSSSLPLALSGCPRSADTVTLTVNKLNVDSLKLLSKSGAKSMQGVLIR